MNEILSQIHGKILTKVIIDLMMEYIPNLEFDLFYAEASFVDEDWKLQPVKPKTIRRLYGCSVGFSDGINKWRFKCLTSGGGNGGIGIISSIDGIASGRDTTLWGSKKINYSYFWGSGMGLHKYKNGSSIRSGGTAKRQRSKDDIVTVELNLEMNQLIFYINEEKQGSVAIASGETFYPAIETNEPKPIFQFLGEVIAK